MPPLLLYFNSVRVGVFLNADLIVYGTIWTTPQQVADESKQAEVLKIRHELIVEEMIYWSTPPRSYLKRGVQHLGYEIMNPSSETWLKPALQTVMQSAVVGAWTAFETLLEELWVACLNERPRLGFVALDAEPLIDDDEETIEKKRRKPIPIPSWLLKDRDFDIRKSMGRLLQEQGKWDFARRDKAFDAYFKVFGKADKLKAVFDSAQLKWLAGTRNAIVHNAGRADDEFIKLTKDHIVLSHVKPNDLIPFDAKLTAEFVNNSIEAGSEIIEFVNLWLTDNPT